MGFSCPVSDAVPPWHIRHRAPPLLFALLVEASLPGVRTRRGQDLSDGLLFPVPSQVLGPLGAQGTKCTRCSDTQGQGGTRPSPGTSLPTASRLTGQRGPPPALTQPPDTAPGDLATKPPYCLSLCWEQSWRCHRQSPIPPGVEVLLPRGPLQTTSRAGEGGRSSLDVGNRMKGCEERASRQQHPRVPGLPAVDARSAPGDSEHPGAEACLPRFPLSRAWRRTGCHMGSPWEVGSS